MLRKWFLDGLDEVWGGLEVVWGGLGCFGVVWGVSTDPHVAVVFSEGRMTARGRHCWEFGFYCNISGEFLDYIFYPKMKNGCAHQNKFADHNR